MAGIAGNGEGEVGAGTLYFYYILFIYYLSFYYTFGQLNGLVLTFRACFVQVQTLPLVNVGAKVETGERYRKCFEI